MGVIKKILYRGEILGKPRHRNLFLDMEENIHIHYRDLRIELSRSEFEDIAGIFAKQSTELLQIIGEKNYQDGKLPNANQDDVRIWTESKLRHEVKYHPQRFSLEECGDGYHFHYRNYKLLIDKNEFHQIARLFANLDLHGPYASTYAEVLHLLEANEVDFTFDIGNVPDEILAISVAHHHLPKIRDIFNYIGFVATDVATGKKCYANDTLRVIVRAEKQRSALDYRHIRGLNTTVRLADYLPARGTAIDPIELNLLKCQVLDLYYAVKSGLARNINLAPQAWLYAPANRQVIFPYKSTLSVANPKTEAEALYRAWSSLINGCQLGFVKPGKQVLPPDVQQKLKQQIDQALLQEIASYIAVDKIWIMGSALRGELGAYHAPFIHGKLAKLGSDIDILVEINPDREADIPGFWDLHMEQASNHCAIYHITQIPLTTGIAAWRDQFPNIPFIQHLIDAYVYLPSHGYRAEIDVFLKKFGARLFYGRSRDGLHYRSAEESGIAAQLRTLYGFQEVAVERLKVSTENAIFKVITGNRDYILKLFKVSGNYPRTRVAEHAAYEAQLVTQLIDHGIPTAGVLPVSAGLESRVNDLPALLFERIPGTVQQRPDYPLDRICAALANIHRVQIERPLSLAANFPFDDTCMIWLPQFELYRNRHDLDAEITQAFAALAPLAAPCHVGENRSKWFARSPAVHNHGDVTPKNVIYGENGPAVFFDFNNAFFGPRMADVIDGAIEFSLAEKYFHLANFDRFDLFIANYSVASPLCAEELEDLPHWTVLIGIIKFAKEVKTLLEKPKESLRRKRALAVADFLIARHGKR